MGTTSRLPKIAGDVVTWGAVWSALSILLQGFSWPMWVDEAFSLIAVPTSPNLFVAALLLIVGEALHRRLRVAWWIVVLFQGLAALTFLSGLAFVFSDFDELMNDAELWATSRPPLG